MQLTGGQSHKYQQLPLISVEEFLEQFPEHVDDDESALMTARINHEHVERQKLEEQRQGLLKRKQALIAENNKRKADLASLDQDLEKFIDVRFCTANGCIYTNVITGCTTHSKDTGKGILMSLKHALFVLHSAVLLASTGARIWLVSRWMVSMAQVASI